MKRWALAAFLLLAGPASAQFDPTQSTTNAATPTAAASLIVKTGPGGFFTGYAISGTAGYLMAFDATAVPADGAVSPIAVCAQAVGVGCFIDLEPQGIPFTNGLVLVYSSTGPFTKTASATAFINAQYR
jgi:hypothetical protein